MTYEPLAGRTVVELIGRSSPLILRDPIVIVVVAVFVLISVCLCAAESSARIKRATAPLNVTISWATHDDGDSLMAVVSFRLQSAFRHDNQTTTVKLYWRRQTCNAQLGFKYCDLPNSDNSRTYYAHYNKVLLRHQIHQGLTVVRWM